MGKEAKEGSVVKVHYTGRYKDGEVFDTSRDRDPLEFIVGRGKVIPGFEKAVLGMKEGEVKTGIIVKPDEGYGERNESLIAEISKTDVPPDIDLKEGMQLEMGNEQGQTMSVIITRIFDDKIELDANHPLAGKIIEFDIEIIEIA